MRAAESDQLLRNGRRARLLHAGVYLTTAVLLLSGISLLGEGIPGLEALFGGHVGAARWHRWIGFGLVGCGLLVPALTPAAVGGFLLESVRFRGTDVGWFVSYPRFLLRPGLNAPSRHEGHFDPGQRLMNLGVLASFAVLSVTGIVMAFPQLVVPAAFALSLRLHEAATWVLIAAIVGHLVVASGVLPAYRGVWHAMHADGRVTRTLADRLWPAWAERAMRAEPHERTSPQ
jgi:cytochrome b subunit of formate dehydrogenase